MINKIGETYIVYIVRERANLEVHCSDCPANISDTCNQKNTHD